jgi:hypothetical protein
MTPAGFPVDHPIRKMEALISSRPAKMFQNGRDTSKSRNSISYSLTSTGIEAAEALIGFKLATVASLDAGATQKAQPKKARVPRTKESFSIVKDLDLSEKSNSQSLRSFYADKAPGSEMEHVAVFVYFLERIAKIDAVTLNHIYSCYRDIGRKVPISLKQIAWNTASNNGWIDTQSMESIKVATPGENFVEYDLPKKKAK